MDLTEELQKAREAALAAGIEIMKVYDSADVSVQTKGDGSPVTLADLAGNEAIVTLLRREFPRHALLTEEEVDNQDRLNAQWVWIIDPLDGTKEFISRNGEFTVNVALTCDGVPVLGVVFIPVKRELYWASKGQGAFLQIGNEEPRRLTVSDRSATARMVLAASRSHAGPKVEALLKKYPFADLKSRGSSLKGCMIAAGEADVYYRFGPTNEWDICAMHAVVAEAGGVLTDLDGAPMTYNNAKTLNSGFVASNNTIHAQLVEMGQRLDD